MGGWARAAAGSIARHFTDLWQTAGSPFRRMDMLDDGRSNRGYPTNEEKILNPSIRGAARLLACAALPFIAVAPAMAAGPPSWSASCSTREAGGEVAGEARQSAPQPKTRRNRPMLISVVNRSKKLTDAALQAAVRAVNRQLEEDFYPHWQFGARLRVDSAGRVPGAARQQDRPAHAAGPARRRRALHRRQGHDGGHRGLPRRQQRRRAVRLRVPRRLLRRRQRLDGGAVARGASSWWAIR